MSNTTNKMRVDLRYTRTFSHSVIIEVPTSFNKDEIDTVLKKHRHYAPAEDFRQWQGYEYGECTIKEVAPSEPATLLAHKDEWDRVQVVKPQYKLAKSHCVSAGVDADVFDALKKEVFSYSNPHVDDEMIIDLCGLEPEEIMERFAGKLGGYDAQDLIGASYLTVYVE